MVQVKVLGRLAAKVIFGSVPLHMITVGELVTRGLGTTVTVIVSGTPGQAPVVAVGVTIY